jgi:hypothetical protein
MSEQNFPTRNELEAKVIAKAWQDEEFKQQLLNHPRATIIQEWGLKDIPDDVDIKVIEENSNTLYIVLPMKPITTHGQELSEEQLEAVAGGIDVVGIAKSVWLGLKRC